MNWIFWAMPGAAVIHVIEEFFYPGGFIDVMRRMNPKLAGFVTTPFAIIINGAFLVLCVLGAIVGTAVPVFSLSVAALIGLNGLIHLIGTLKTRRYVPGLISGILLYVPIAVYLYREFILSGQFTLLQGILSGVFGLLYQAVPIGYLTIAARLTKHA
jgi:hypothetical protein